MAKKTTDRAGSPITVRDIFYILTLTIPMAVTWGVYSTKIGNIADDLREIKTVDNVIKGENKEFNKRINQLKLELNDARNDTKNNKQSVDTLKQEDKHIKEHIRDLHK